MIITTNYIKHDIIWAICLSRHMSQIKLKGIMFSTPGKTTNKSKSSRLRVSDSRPCMAISTISRAVHLFAQLKITVFKTNHQNTYLPIHADLFKKPRQFRSRNSKWLLPTYKRISLLLPLGKPPSALFDYKWLSNIRFKNWNISYCKFPFHKHSGSQSKL